MVGFESIEKKVKFKSFGKTKSSTKKFCDKKICKQCKLVRCDPGAGRSAEEQQLSVDSKCMYCRTQYEKDDELLKRQSQRLEKVN